MKRKKKTIHHLCPRHWKSSVGPGSAFPSQHHSLYRSPGSGSSCACTVVETSLWKLFARSRWAHNSSSELMFSPVITQHNQRNIWLHSGLWWNIQSQREMNDQGVISTHLLSCKLYLDVRINQVLIFSYEGLFDVGHNAGVHSRKSLGSVDLQIVTSPLSLCRHPIWQQEIAGKKRQEEET